MLGAFASSASAADVWLWACHGPGGQPITTPFEAEGNNAEAVTFGGGCGADAGPAGAGHTLRFLGTQPVSGASVTLSYSAPPGTTVKQVRVVRRTHGFDQAGAADAQMYSATFNGAPLGTEKRVLGDGDLTADTTYTAPGSGSGPLVFKLACVNTCAATATPVSVDITGVAFLVDDTQAPSGGKPAGNTPVMDDMSLNADFFLDNVGLDYAVMTVTGNGRTLTSPPARFGRCDDLSAGSATNDRPLDPTRCVRDTGSTKLSVSTKDLAPGIYFRSVTVYDAAGNAYDALTNEPFEVWHPVLGSPTQTLTIGTSDLVIPESGGTQQNPGGGGGVQGTQRSSCRSPRLSVLLRSKPLRISRGVPVLLYKKKYRFQGRLTCVIDGKRRSAPKRTRVDIFNQVGKKTVRKPRTAIRSAGAVDLKLAFTSSRAVIFRFTNADGQRSQVRIRVKVEKRKKATRR